MLPFLLQALAWCTEDYYAIALWCKQTLEMFFAMLVTRTKPFALLKLTQERLKESLFTMHNTRKVLE